MLKRFDDSVRRVLHEMPAVTRADVRGQAVVQDGDVLPWVSAAVEARVCSTAIAACKT